VHREPVKQRIIRSMVSLCAESNMMVIAEGIEHAEERDQLAELNCDLMQGYLFARPGRPFPTIAW
jgi:EAL domain-containing protein (putative c-di-GMP-specific phosphodiesterase class I)